VVSKVKPLFICFWIVDLLPGFGRGSLLCSTSLVTLPLFMMFSLFAIEAGPLSVRSQSLQSLSTVSISFGFLGIKKDLLIRMFLSHQQST
jgi:hypothetical protein